MSDVYSDPNDKRPLLVRDPCKALFKLDLINRTISSLERLGGVDEATRIRLRKELMEMMGVEGDPAAVCSPVIVEHWIDEKKTRKTKASSKK